MLVRTDSGGGTHAFVGWLHRRWLSYSVGFTLPGNAADLIATVLARAWTPRLRR